MNRLRIMTIVGTRPEVIRLSCVIQRLRSEKAVEHMLVHTGQNYDYELNEIFFSDLGLDPPERYLKAVGKNLAETIGLIIAKSDEALAEFQPDALLILGDTNSCLSAIAAKRRKIPIFHMEAGNRCFDQRVPEEVNRKIVDHIADINLPYSTLARTHLLREGVQPDRVIKTGSPMYEVLQTHRAKIEHSEVLQTLSLQPKQYFLVSSHREENVDDKARLAQLLDVLNRLAKEFEIPVLVSTHPRLRKRIEESGLKPAQGLQFVKPFGFTDYVKLQMNARVVLSDSGTITEESSILNFPALNLRETHERPEGMEEGTVMMVGYSWERIRQGISIVGKQADNCGRVVEIVQDYTSPFVSEKILRIVLSYVDYVNHHVWQKY